MLTYVPPTKKPNVRTDRAKANDFEIYAYRPLEAPWKYLCPYEFLMHWRAEPLLIPNYYRNRSLPPRTQWTAEGWDLIGSDEYKSGKTTAKPGIHYTALSPTTTDYFLFPEHPQDIYHSFRHAWVLVRRPRPIVIVIEGLKKPSASRTAVENAKY